MISMGLCDLVQSEMVSFQLTFSHYLFNTTSIKHKTNTAVFIHMLSHMFIVGKVSEGLTLWDWNQAIDLEKKEEQSVHLLLHRCLRMRVPPHVKCLLSCASQRSRN